MLYPVTMCKGLFLIICAALALWSAKTSAAVASSCTKIVAQGNPEYPPYLWKSRKQVSQMSGAIVDLIKIISQEIDIPIEVRYRGTWARVQEDARHGRLDLVAGAFKTEDRLGYLHYFNPPITQTHSIIWTHKQKPFLYKKWSDLEGLQGITVHKNSFGQEFDTYAKKSLQITTVASLEQAFNMLKNHRVDYLIYEDRPSHAYAEKVGHEQILALSSPISSEPLFFAMSKKSVCNSPLIQKKINTALHKVLSRNTMDQLLEKNWQLWVKEEQSNPISNP